MTSLPATPKYTRILAIDGGGIRGLIPGQLLSNLERKLRQRAGEDIRLADVFDLVAGTSTGGILSCIYLCPDSPGAERARPRFEAAQAVELYMERGQEIFDIPTLHRIRSAGGVADEKYPSAGLEEALDEYLGELRLRHLLKPCLIPAYDIKERCAHLFTQHEAHRTGRDFRVTDIARATSAAPTFFEAARVESDSKVPYHLIDGGVFANNPALCAYAEARSALPGRPKAKDMVILSVGTGTSEKPYDYDEAKDWGLVGWARPLIDIFMSGVAETVHYQLNQIYDAVERPQQYLRLNVDLSDEPEARDMDNASTENLHRLRDLGQKLAEDSASDLDSILELLLANRDN